MNKIATLNALLAELGRRGVVPRLPQEDEDPSPDPIERQTEYLAVRLRFLTPTSIDAAIGNAKILLEAIGRESIRLAA
jgi:hypothetical protein